jgi:beta-glucosidase
VIQGEGGPWLPADFRFGTSTSAYQVEGAVADDGRGPSVWDTFCAEPGRIVDGSSGSVAADHYHRVDEDVALLAELGLGAYRFSTAWPRVRPDGRGVNRAGVDFYARLVDTLLDRGIRPWLTLYHWDLPQALEDEGGWTNRDTAYRFAEYALTLYDAIGDRCPVWTTLNEPFCSAFLGHAGGQHAPGRRDPAAALVAAHHLLLGHGLVVDELRRRGTTADLGITLNLTVADPFDPSDEADVDAARRVDALHNRLFLDATLRGRYPEDLYDDTAHLRFAGRPWRDVVRDGDLAQIQQPLDVLGVNYYHGDAVSGRPQPGAPGFGSGRPGWTTGSPFAGSEHVTFPRRGLPRTHMGWEVQPEGLTRLLRRLDDYGVPPIYVTENGAAYADRVGPDGAVHDPDRVAYIDSHLRAVHDAIAAGVDVRGFFQWSLLDNFEWAYGYDKRFGIVHVDYTTQRRTPKSSARFYAEVAATGRLGSLP